ncbi:grainyhead-like, partial [Rhizopus azygosporus]
MKSVAMQQNVTMDQSHMPPLNPASSIRYDICLEGNPSDDNNMFQFQVTDCVTAPTAAAQKVDEPPLTYLNKGQHYNITLKDVKGYDGDIISTAIITFHDEAHRAGATDYWKQFDRIVFRWNGKAGASIYVKFNCLSTDFSRIKGVKGIPLRLQIESYQQGMPHIEKTYSRIKLFRDKGAERKNKDDARHIERQLEKLRGKNGEPHPLWLAYSPTSPVTVFRELVTPEEDMAEDMHRRGLIASPSSSNILLPLPSPVPAPVNFMPGPMRRSFSTSFQPAPAVDMHYPFPAQVPIGYDPSYVPQRRRRIAKLSVLIKFESDD